MYKFKYTKYLGAILFLVLSVYGCGDVFATINPNNYSINFSIQNQDQGVSVPGSFDGERYVLIPRTLSVSTNAPSGYRIYVDVPSNEESQGDLVF